MANEMLVERGEKERTVPAKVSVCKLSGIGYSANLCGQRQGPWLTLRLTCPLLADLPEELPRMRKLERP